MHPSALRLRGGRTAILAIIQSGLLIVSTVLPTAVVAQDAPIEPVSSAPALWDEVTPAAAAPPPQGLFIASDPRVLHLGVGETASLAAFTCPLPAADGSPFGSDGEPGTGDDACTPAPDAVWTFRDEGYVTMTREEGAKISVRADAFTPSEGTEVIAQLGDLRDTKDLVIAPASQPEQQPEPKAEPEQQPQPQPQPEPRADEPAAEPETKADEPRADEPTAESEPKADEPKADESRGEPEADEPKADDPTAEPEAKAEESGPQSEEPKSEPKADEPKADKPEADEQPPQDEPQRAEPRSEPKDVEQPTLEETNQAEPEAEPEPRADEPAAEPKADEPKADEPTAEPKASEQPPQDESQRAEPESEPKADEPKADEPTAEPEAKAEEPEPSAEEPVPSADGPPTELAPAPDVPSTQEAAPADETPVAPPALEAQPVRDYIVTFEPSVPNTIQLEIVASSGVTLIDSIAVLNMRVVTATASQADALRADRAVLRVELDEVRAAEALTSDPAIDEQWSLPRIGWDDAYRSIDPSGSAVVAVLDTGVASHPDLLSRLIAGRSMLDGGDGLQDSNGHGTAMAGIIAAAVDNGSGVAGVAFDGVVILPVTVLGPDATGQDSDVIEGLVWATNQGADVALMAFSNSGFSSSLQTAIDYAWENGVVLVAAVGNDASDVSSYPAGMAGVIGVSATNRADELASFSNFGESVFLAAPGVDIPTTAAVGGVSGVEGTSAAAAHVAAAAGLLRANDPGVGNGVVAARLARSAEPAGSASQTGNGRLNLYRPLLDTDDTSIKPTGAPGGGGPFVGPYVAASSNFTVTPASQSVAAGSTNNFTWTFTAANSASRATTTFRIPAGWTAPSAAAGAGQVIVTAGTCSATLASVAGQVVTIDQGPGSGTCSNGQTFTLQYLQATAPTPASPPQTYTFVNQHGTDPTVTVGSASADLSVTKSDGVTSVTAGDGITRTFTITVSNGGPSNAAAVSLTDTWPAGYTRGTVTPSAGSCVGSPSFTCTFGTLTPAATRTVTVTYTVPAGTAAGSVTNTATVTSTTSDPSAANNSASDTNTVLTSADLSVTKTDGVASVTAGDGITRTFTITVSNGGPSNAAAVSLTDTWPAGYTRGTVTPSAGSCVGSPSFTCTFGTLTPAATRTVTVTYTVPAGTAAGSVTNTATVTSTTSDPSAANNSASDTNTVLTSADLSVTKTDGVASVTAGDGITRTFTITVSNGGPSNAAAVSLSDTWPAGYTRGTLPAGCTDGGAGTDFDCGVASLAPGASASFAVDYTVPAGTAAGSVTNTATVTSTTPDPSPGDDTASDTNSVTTSADLSVTKSDGVGSVTAGAATVHTFTITVSNGGPSTASGISLSDTWPSGYARGTLPAGCTDAGAGTDFDCAVASLAPGASASFAVDYTVPAGTTTSQTNTVTVSATTPDPSPGDDTASDTNSVTTSADLSVTKAVSPGTAVQGGTVTYNFTLANAGPSDAASVALSDSFPASLQGISVVDDGPYTCGPIVGSTVTCTIASHAVGVSATIIVTATVAPGSYSDLTSVPNTASVSSSTSDPSLANNSATATFTIRSTPLIHVSKSATPASVPEPGGTVTFGVVVTNPGDVAVSLTSLVDSVHGDLNAKGDCTLPQPLAPGGSYVCSFSAVVGGNAGLTETDVVTARASTTDGRTATSSDDAAVAITNVLPAIAVTRTPSSSELVEPGGDVTYTVTIENLVAEDLTIVSITDDMFGDLGDAQITDVKDNSCVDLVGATIAARASVACQFTARVTGQAGDRLVNTVTVEAADDDVVPPPSAVTPPAGTVVSASARAVVRIVAADQGGQHEDAGAGGGDAQPATDMLPATDPESVTAQPRGTTAWALGILLAAMAIVGGLWVVRRRRLADLGR